MCIGLLAELAALLLEILSTDALELQLEFQSIGFGLQCGLGALIRFSMVVIALS